MKDEKANDPNPEIAAESAVPSAPSPSRWRMLLARIRSGRIPADGTSVGNGAFASSPAETATFSGAPSPRTLSLRAVLGVLRRPRVLIGTFAVCAIATGFVGSWWYSCGYDGCPTVDQLRAWQPTEGGMLLDRAGDIIAPLAPVKRVNVRIARVPATVQAAFIAVEDRRFRTHHGIDWYGVARAAVMNVRAGGVREGASTITMQLARNVFLSHRAAERSFGRKLLEVRYATLLEAALSKDEILERYLNAIYLGNGVYGVEGASRDLFGKGVKSVTLAEAAVLAGLPKAPSGYSPRNDMRRARARRNVVLDVIEREKVATPAQVAAARNAPLAVARNEWVPRVVDSWAVEMVRGTLDSLRKAGIIPSTLNDGQLRVQSSFDRRAQVAAERAVASGAAQVDAERDGWYGDGSRTQGALVAIDPATGALRALVGGRRMERRGYNRAVRAHRQPGSAFKPFVYATALLNGYTSATMVDDEPIEIEVGDDIWTPANFDDDYAGSITLQDALARSSNAATVRISRDVGIARVAQLAHAQGITSTLPLVPALALGAGAVTPIELTTAYAPFANGGVRVTPYAVERVEDVFGRVLWQHPLVATPRVLDPADAFLVTSLLRGVVDNGTGRGVRSAGIRGPVAGKTGTTNDGADIWFVGYTPSIVAAIWFGADEPRPLGGAATGGRFAAPAWARFISDGWHSPERDSAWRAPAGVESRQIDLASGQLAGEWCGESRRAWFRTGTAPRNTCSGEEHVAFNDIGEMIGELAGMPEVPAAPPVPRVPRPSRSRGIDVDTRDLGSTVKDVLRAVAKAGDGNAVSRRLIAELRNIAREQERAARREAERLKREQQQRDQQFRARGTY